MCTCERPSGFQVGAIQISVPSTICRTRASLAYCEVNVSAAYIAATGVPSSRAWWLATMRWVGSSSSSATLPEILSAKRWRPCAVGGTP